MKGISPLIASVLLIAITMAVAAILANWVTSYTQTTIQNVQTCIGGSVSYVSSDYPKLDGSNLVAAIEARYVPLGSFKFIVLYDDDTVKTYEDTLDTNLGPGAVGTIKTGTVSDIASISKVRVSSNCSNVYIDFTTLR